MRKLAGNLLFIGLVAIGGIVGPLSGCQPNAAQPLDRYAGHLPLEAGPERNSEVLKDAGVKRLLRKTVPKHWRDAMYGELTMVEPNIVVGDWLLVRGCTPYDCYWKSYVLALRLDSSAIAFFGFETSESEPSTFSVQCFSSEAIHVRQASPELKKELSIASPKSFPWVDSLSCPGKYSVPAPDPTVATNPFDAWRQCPETESEMTERLAEMDDLAGQFYYLPDEKRVQLARATGWPAVFLLHIASWTLPEKSGTADSGDCYVYFREAEEALASKQSKRAQDSAAAWESCIWGLYREVPQEVTDVANCIKLVHAGGKR